jgi:four helix bundle protein
MPVRRNRAKIGCGIVNLVDHDLRAPHQPGTEPALLVFVTPQELRNRTRDFAVAVSLTLKPLLAQLSSRHAADQLCRSATSVAANYRAACVARSRAEFISRLSVVLEEADEAVYWLELLAETEPRTHEARAELLAEARQLARIFSASRRTLKDHDKMSRPNARAAK